MLWEDETPRGHFSPYPRVPSLTPKIVISADILSSQCSKKAAPCSACREEGLTWPDMTGHRVIKVPLPAHSLWLRPTCTRPWSKQSWDGAPGLPSRVGVLSESCGERGQKLPLLQKQLKCALKKCSRLPRVALQIPPRPQVQVVLPSPAASWTKMWFYSHKPRMPFLT